MFDWGARAVSDILEKQDSFGLEEALNSIQSRPWLIDDLDLWLSRLKVKSKHIICAIILSEKNCILIIESIT